MDEKQALYEHLFREFETEHKRADVYMERNYKVLAFWGAAMSALVAYGLKMEVETSGKYLVAGVFAYLIPLINVICAVFYAFNAYTNVCSSIRAECLHGVLNKLILEHFNDSFNELDDQHLALRTLLPKYVLNSRKVSGMTYLIPIALFLSAFVGSYLYSILECGLSYWPIWVSAGVAALVCIPMVITYINQLIPVAKERTMMMKKNNTV